MAEESGAFSSLVDEWSGMPPLARDDVRSVDRSQLQRAYRDQQEWEARVEARAARTVRRRVGPSAFESLYVQAQNDNVTSALADGIPRLLKIAAVPLAGAALLVSLALGKLSTLVASVGLVVALAGVLALLGVRMDWALVKSRASGVTVAGVGLLVSLIAVAVIPAGWPPAGREVALQLGVGNWPIVADYLAPSGEREAAFLEAVGTIQVNGVVELPQLTVERGLAACSAAAGDNLTRWVTATSTEVGSRETALSIASAATAHLCA